QWQAVKYDDCSGRVRQGIGESAQIVLVHSMGLLVAARALSKLLLEATPLFFRIIQLAEGVTDFQASNKNLEAFHPVGFVPFIFGERRNGQRKIVNNCRLEKLRFGHRLE